MDGDYSIHPTVRMDVPGGWKEDKVNAFLTEGRTKDQNEAYDFLSKLLNWRKDQPLVHHGKLMHYIPEDNIYVYFRYNESKSVMVIMNGNPSEKTLSTKRLVPINSALAAVCCKNLCLILLCNFNRITKRTAMHW